MMLRAAYAVCNVLLSLILFPVTCTSRWTAPGSFQCSLCCCFLCHLDFERIFCGKQIAEDIAGNWQGKGKWTFWKEGELWAVEIWFIPSVCNRLVRQSQEWCLRLIPTKCYYTKWLSHRQHESSVRFHCLDWSLPWQNYRQSLCNSRADCFSLFIQTGGQQPMQKQSTDTAENRINAALSPDLALRGECML